MTWLQSQALFQRKVWKPEEPPTSGLTPEEKSRISEVLADESKMLEGLIRLQAEKEEANLIEKISDAIVRSICQNAQKIPVSRKENGEYHALLPGGVTLAIGYVDDET